MITFESEGDPRAVSVEAAASAGRRRRAHADAALSVVLGRGNL